MKGSFLFVILLAVVNSFAQQLPKSDSLRAVYLAHLKKVSNQFSDRYYPHRSEIYSLNEKQFLNKIDSLRKPFEKELAVYEQLVKGGDSKFISDEHRDIVYFFDGIILDYPYFHETHTGKKTRLSVATQAKLDAHLSDFNRPDLLTSRDVKSYIESYLRHQSSIELRKTVYKKSDNKRLDAYLTLLPVYFTNQQCKEYWQFHYINAHLEDWGSKHLETAVSKFLSTCTNERYKEIVDSVYRESVNGRKDHLIRTYKTVNGYDLDIHLFLPDSIDKKRKSPVMVYFSGGSWTKGNPEWAFYNCASYAKKGWVGVSVEYRLADRHETTPFEAVKDARSAIRWLRMNADKYAIDVNRIVASGNSAGGHLVLTTALANEWNEPTDDLNVSASPNLLLVNAGVYDLYAEEATDWVTRDLNDKNLAKKISPLHLMKNGLPPMLLIHGTNDRSVGYATAKAFADSMEKAANDFEFHTLEGAPHAIWFDGRYSGKVATLRKAFLKKYGYE